MNLVTYVVAGVVGLLTAYRVWRLLSGPLARCLEDLLPSKVSADLGIFIRFAVLVSGTAAAATRSGFFASAMAQSGPGAVPSPGASNVVVQNALGAVLSALSASVGILFMFFAAAIAGHVVLKGFQLLRSSKDDGRGGPET